MSHSSRSVIRPVAMAAAILLAAILAACGDAAPSPTAHAPRQTTALPSASLSPAAEPSAAPSVPLSPAAANPLPGAAPTDQPPTPLPLPAPHPYNSAWASERIDAVIALYRPTPAGAALLRSLDLRQMRGEPGFFGSYGFDAWAGVGEAKPIGVMHELMHSYWGGFPVIGRPELGWQRQEGQDIAPAIAGYHQDILSFMAQPPDDYEMLRQRLRNLPEVSSENPGPLFHHLEADLPYTTGGDLGLVPPILRKYWGLFLSDGPFRTWEQAAGWFQSLSGEERSIAGKYLGFEHLDLRQYPALSAHTPPDAALSNAAQMLAREERQRLTDLAEHFDLLIGDAQLDEDFRFWRGYLQDKMALYRLHSEHLESLTLPRARELSDALKFLSTLYGSPTSRDLMLADRISVQPFLVNLLPAVDNPTLLRLFANSPNLPEGATLQATASFVERLERFAAVVDRVLAGGRESPERGWQELESFLAATGLEQEQDLKLFFNLLHDAGPDLARRIMSAADKATVRALMIPVPVQLRTILPPEELLDKLDITADAAEADLSRGVALLIAEPSGNYRIDEPFLERLYAVMAERARTSPGQAARVMAATPFPLEGMILRQPAAAAAALSAAPGLAADLVAGGDAVNAPPARIIYRLIMADPSLAAGLVIALERRGESRSVTESLAYFAYDKARESRFPQLPISLSHDGAFLNALLERQGEEWLQRRLAGAVALYRERAAAGEVAPDFLRHYRETLQAAANTLSPDAGSRLTGVIQSAFD